MRKSKSIEKWEPYNKKKKKRKKKKERARPESFVIWDQVSGNDKWAQFKYLKLEEEGGWKNPTLRKEL